MNASAPQLNIRTFLNPFEIYSDSRGHGYQGPSRYVRLGRVTPPGGGAIAKCWDGIRVAVTGKESLRILRVSETSPPANDHKSAIGQGGHRIDASRNYWEGSGLKIDSASTDVAWAHGHYKERILTSARNGELIMWDANASGARVLQRSKAHIRSIHKVAVSSMRDSYCITGSADGDLRVWDLNDISKSIVRIHHPTSVRSIVFSPSPWQTAQAAVGLDNGSIYRWDLRMGQRGQLDKLPVAHTGPVTALDWCYTGPQETPGMGVGGGQAEQESNGMGWLVSGGLDRCVKIWDLTSPAANAHIPHKPTYTLHSSFAIRRVEWRPGYECELAIVSNAEYAIPSADANQGAPGSGTPESTSKPGLLTRVSSGLGLDSLMRSGAGAGAGEKLSTPAASSSRTAPSGPAMDLGDAVEIWDVRRGWIAKWSVTGSAAEGGVTDIAFTDSHALLTQNTSGSFVQLDLREVTKPLDTIPRVATTWEATGSMTFIVDDSDLQKWEMPYDDINPEQRIPADLRNKSTLKALGDPPARIASQSVATYALDDDLESGTLDLETFTTLARRYIFEGRDKRDICVYNSEVALAAGHEAAAQVWLLLGACLSRYLPRVAPPDPTAKVKKVPSPLAPSLPYNQSHVSPQASASMSSYTFPGPSSSKNTDAVSAADGDGGRGSLLFSTSSTRRSTTDSHSMSLANSAGLGQKSSVNAVSRSHSRSLSKLGTPLSSTSSSPRNAPSALPLLPPITPRRSSFFARRQSMDLGGLNTSILRRPSLPVTPAHPLAASPSDRHTPSSSSMKNVGEGVLDESDSDSGSNQEDGDEESGEGEEETAGAYSSDDATRSGPLRSATSAVLSASRLFPAPSPLSRVAGKQSWTEDENEDTEVGRPRQRREDEEDDVHEDDGYMPSPQSTDSDSDSSGRSRTNLTPSQRASRRSKSRRRSSTKRLKSRSRSSTVASLAAPPQILAHQDSRGSIRTVIANATHAESPLKYREHELMEENPVVDVERRFQSQIRAGTGHSRAKSQTLVELVSGPNSKARPGSICEPLGQEQSPETKSQLTERRIEAITVEERRFRDATLELLRGALETFCEDGDVQMCAMLALLAPEELKISQLRTARFLDSYIDFLTRVRLYACAAYLRKYCDTEDIRKSTMIETIIYTSCGKCRKPLMLPAGSFHGKSFSKGAFSYCLGCKVSPIKCSICRLPVRTLLFQCAICNHGGHQTCYRQYYLQKPMVDLPSSFFPVSQDPRGRTSLRKHSSSAEDDTASIIGVSRRSVEPPSRADNDSPINIPHNTPDHFNAGSPVQRSSKMLVGHPCAAGCGHYCWAANANIES